MKLSRRNFLKAREQMNTSVPLEDMGTRRQMAEWLASQLDEMGVSNANRIIAIIGYLKSHGWKPEYTRNLREIDFSPLLKCTCEKCKGEGNIQQQRIDNGDGTTTVRFRSKPLTGPIRESDPMPVDPWLLNLFVEKVCGEDE